MDEALQVDRGKFPKEDSENSQNRFSTTPSLFTDVMHKARK